MEGALDPHALEAAAARLASADALLVCAGAGMGVDSGLPDFRGDAGFWRAYPALGQRGLRFVEAASPHTFDADPALAWGFYGHRLALYRRTQAHAGFGLLLRWMRGLPQGGAVFTSNVDGQFQRAGFGDLPLLECHGSIHHLQCTRPCSRAIWPADGFEPQTDDTQCRLLNAAPRCPHCGALARPNILMFGDDRWQPDRAQAQEVALLHWLARARRPVVVEIGAGTAVATVRHFSQHAANRPGGSLIRINPQDSRTARQADVSLTAGALAALRALDERLGWRGSVAARQP